MGTKISRIVALFCLFLALLPTHNVAAESLNRANISISQTISPIPSRVGEEITSTVVVVNNDNRDAEISLGGIEIDPAIPTNVVVTDGQGEVLCESLPCSKILQPGESLHAVARFTADRVLYAYLHWEILNEGYSMSQGAAVIQIISELTIGCPDYMGESQYTYVCNFLLEDVHYGDVYLSWDVWEDDGPRNRFYTLDGVIRWWEISAQEIGQSRAIHAGVEIRENVYDSPELRWNSYNVEAEKLVTTVENSFQMEMELPAVAALNKSLEIHSGDPNMPCDRIEYRHQLVTAGGYEEWWEGKMIHFEHPGEYTVTALATCFVGSDPGITAYNYAQTFPVSVIDYKYTTHLPIVSR